MRSAGRERSIAAATRTSPGYASDPTGPASVPKTASRSWGARSADQNESGSSASTTPPGGGPTSPAWEAAASSRSRAGSGRMAATTGRPGSTPTQGAEPTGGRRDRFREAKPAGRGAREAGTESNPSRRAWVASACSALGQTRSPCPWCSDSRAFCATNRIKTADWFADRLSAPCPQKVSSSSR